MLRFLGYILQMENKCPKCYECEDRCICNNCNICEQYNCICTDDETVEDRLVRCARCNTYDCVCDDSDFEESLETNEICPDCQWSLKIMDGIKLECACKL
jgi:hypothetical protein